MAEAKELTVTVHIDLEDLAQQAFDECGYKGHTLREWADLLTSGPIEGIWLCDPLKNTSCKKSCCFLNGGRCYQTVFERFAMDPLPDE